MSPTHWLIWAQVSDYDEYLNEYTLVDWENNFAPLEYMKLEEKNIEVFEETISLTNYESEDEPKSEAEAEADVDMEEAPFTIEDLQNMSQNELVKWCRKYNLFTKEWLNTIKSRAEMRPALAKKFGLEGSTVSDSVSDWHQKREESSKATAAFFQLASVVAITSTISNFNPKNKDHAERFMKQYRKKHGKGLTRS